MKIIQKLKERLRSIRKIKELEKRPNEIPALVELAFDLDNLQKPDELNKNNKRILPEDKTPR